MKGNKPAEDWVPIKSISNGIITLDNGYLVSGVKVEAKNIFILDVGSRMNVIQSLRTFYNNIDYEYWLICAGRPVDINSYLARLQVQYNNTNDPTIRKILIQDINKANLFMTTQVNAVDTEYFILFKADSADEVTKNLRSLISNLAQSGLIGVQTSDEDLRMTLDNFLNGGKTFTERTVTA